MNIIYPNHFFDTSEHNDLVYKYFNLEVMSSSVGFAALGDLDVPLLGIGGKWGEGKLGDKHWYMISERLGKLGFEGRAVVSDSADNLLMSSECFKSDLWNFNKFFDSDSCTKYSDAELLVVARLLGLRIGESAEFDTLPISKRSVGNLVEALWANVIEFNGDYVFRGVRTWEKKDNFYTPYNVGVKVSTDFDFCCIGFDCNARHWKRLALDIGVTDKFFLAHADYYNSMCEGFWVGDEASLRAWLDTLTPFELCAVFSALKCGEFKAWAVVSGFAFLEGCFGDAVRKLMRNSIFYQVFCVGESFLERVSSSRDKFFYNAEGNWTVAINDYPIGSVKASDVDQLRDCLFDVDSVDRHSFYNDYVNLFDDNKLLRHVLYSMDDFAYISEKAAQLIDWDPEYKAVWDYMKANRVMERYRDRVKIWDWVLSQDIGYSAWAGACVETKDYTGIWYSERPKNWYIMVKEIVRYYLGSVPANVYFFVESERNTDCLLYDLRGLGLEYDWAVMADTWSNHDSYYVFYVDLLKCLVAHGFVAGERVKCRGRVILDASASEAVRAGLKTMLGSEDDLDAMFEGGKAVETQAFLYLPFDTRLAFRRWHDTAPEKTLFDVLRKVYLRGLLHLVDAVGNVSPMALGKIKIGQGAFKFNDAYFLEVFEDKMHFIVRCDGDYSFLRVCDLSGISEFFGVDKLDDLEVVPLSGSLSSVRLSKLEALFQ